MRKFLFASHGYLASGILSSLELIMGMQNNVDIICAYTTQGFDMKSEINKRLDQLDEQDELIVVTDVLGGSVNNEFMDAMGRTKKKVHLISGLNLALLMNLIVAKDDEQATEKIIRSSLEEAKSTMMYCNDTLTSKEPIEDEEF